MRHLAPRERIVAALDVPALEEARALCTALAGQVGLAKVGLELFVAEGAQAVRTAQDAGLPVFLDLKLHDIPNTVEGAAKSAARLGVRMLTVHAAGGRRMIAAARAGLDSASGERALLLAVTVLTSLTPLDLTEQAVPAPLEEHVVRLARLAIDSGADGLVCSPHEVAAIRAALPHRLIGVSCGTPREARAAEEAGADYAGVGAVYATQSKADAGEPIGIAGLLRVAGATCVPVAAIGGIGFANLAEVRRAGVAMAAVISAIAASDDPRAATARLVGIWGGEGP